MRIGIGLPTAVPGVEATSIASWAAEAERGGFDSVGVTDRLVYDNLEPLTVLAAAAATTIITADELAAQLRELDAVGVTDLVLHPCRGDIDQVAALANSLARVRPVRDVVPA